MTGVGVSYSELSGTYPRAHWGDAVIQKASGGDSIGIQVEYYNGSWQLIPNGDLPGNSTGFYSTTAIDSIDLSGLDTTTYNTIRLHASFYRIVVDAPDDPALLNWEVGNSSNYIGIAEHKSEAIIADPMLRVFPSVTTDRLNIVFTAVSPNAQVDLKIYDASGRVIRSFNPNTSENTTNQIIWNRKDDNGRAVSAGVYFVHYTTEDYNKVIKAIILK
jgi:hypothetical protein